MKKLALATSLIATTFLVGCDLDDNDSNPGTSFLRVLHASPDAPNVDVLIDGAAVLENVSYQAGSGYLAVTEGQRKVELRVSGTDTIALSETVTLANTGYYSAIAQNEVSQLELEVLDDSERYKNDSADVTVVHASPAAGTVDVYVTAAGADLPASTILDDVVFDFNETLNDVAAGNYQVRITGGNSTDVVYDSGTLAITGDVTTVAVNSSKGASPVSLLAWGKDGGPAIVLDNTSEVRIVHAVDSVSVDVFAGGAELLGDFEYKETTNGYVKVASGDLAVAIAAADQGIGNALSNLSGTLTLDRGESYTVIAAGDTGDLAAAQLIVLTDTRAATDDTKAYFRLVHGSSAAAADPVDIYLTAAGVAPTDLTATEVTIGQNTGYVEIVPATYDAIIAADGTNTAVVPNTAGLVFAEGDVVTAIAVGNGSGLSPIVLVDKR